MQEMQVRPLGWEDPLKEGMATHSSALAWRIPWREQPSALQSMGVPKSQTCLKCLSTHAQNTSQHKTVNASSLFLHRSRKDIIISK